MNHFACAFVLAIPTSAYRCFATTTINWPPRILGVITRPCSGGSIPLEFKLKMIRHHNAHHLIVKFHFPSLLFSKILDSGSRLVSVLTISNLHQLARLGWWGV